MLNEVEAFEITAAYSDRNLPYLPQPNRVDVVITSELAPIRFTRTAFMLPIRGDSSLVMAQNTRRGIEFAGGHIEVGETAEQAARRECHEETGIVVASVLPIGFLRMISEGSIPEGWRYPHPLSFQQFFAGIVAFEDRNFAPTDECHLPRVLQRHEVAEQLERSRLVLYEAAVTALGL